MRKPTHFMILLMAVSFVTACGGGSGSGAGVSYTGVTNQAVITSENAHALIVGAYQGGNTGSSQGSILGVESVQDMRNVPSRARLIAKALRVSLDRFELAPDERLPATVLAATITETDTVTGSCGGNASLTASVDTVTGNFSGTMNFNNYCEDDVVMSGRANITGSFDLDEGFFAAMTISTNSLSVQACGESLTMAGDITIRIEDFTTVEIAMDIRLRNDADQKVYWLRDLTMTVTESGNHEDITMSGRYYDPDAGYVLISTPEPLRTSFFDDWPESGFLQADGRDNTWARLTAENADTYRITADTDGDGTPDLDEVHAWESDTTC